MHGGDLGCSAEAREHAGSAANLQEMPTQLFARAARQRGSEARDPPPASPAAAGLARQAGERASALGSFIQEASGQFGPGRNRASGYDRPLRAR